MQYSDKIFYRIKKQPSRGSYKLDFFSHNSIKFRKNITPDVLDMARVKGMDSLSFPAIQAKQGNYPYMVTAYPYEVIGNLWRCMKTAVEEDVDYIPYELRPAEHRTSDPVPTPSIFQDNPVKIAPVKEIAYSLLTALDHPKIRWHMIMLDYPDNGQSAIYLRQTNRQLVHNVTGVFRFIVHRTLYDGDLKKGFRCGDANGNHLQIGYDRNTIRESLSVALRHYDARAELITMSYESRGSLNELI